MASLLASTSFTIAVPALTAEFGIPASEAPWTLTGFLTAMTIGMLPTAWLLERLGYRWLFLIALGVLAGAGVAGYFAPSFPVVVGLRILQGAMAGILQPLSMVTVMRLMPAEQRGRASGVLGFAIVLAPVTAPTLAGYLVDHFGWRSLFLMNLPLCALAAPLALALLPDLRSQERRGFDVPGLALLTVFSLALVTAIGALRVSGAASPLALALAVVAAVALAGFIFHARRAAHPILSLEAFADPTFAFGMAVTFSYGFGLYASSYLIPVFLQSAAHFSATNAGAALLPAGVILPFTILLAGRMTDHYPPLSLTIGGLALFGVSALIFGGLGLRFSYAGVVAGAVVGRVGLGFILPALSVASMIHLTREQMSHASVMVSYARQMGATLGIAVPAVFEAWREEALRGHVEAVAWAHSESFVMVAGVFLFALFAASRMRSAPHRRA